MFLNARKTKRLNFKGSQQWKCKLYTKGFIYEHSMVNHKKSKILSRCLETPFFQNNQTHVRSVVSPKISFWTPTCKYSICKIQSCSISVMHINCKRLGKTFIDILTYNMPVKVLYSKVLLRRPTTFSRILKNYLALKGLLNYQMALDINRLNCGSSQSFFFTEKEDSQYAFSSLENPHQLSSTGNAAFTNVDITPCILYGSNKIFWREKGCTQHITALQDKYRIHQ